MSSPNIHVGIMSADKIDFKLHGEYQLIGTKHTFSGDGSVRFENGNLQLVDTEISGDKLYFIPLDKENSEFELKDVTIGVNFHWSKRRIRISGSLKVYYRRGTNYSRKYFVD